MSSMPGERRSAGYLGDLRERPGRRGANVIAIDSGAGLANATLQLRVTVVRLFYDFLVEERVRDRNPVGRGYRDRGRPPGRARGLLRRFEALPWIPTDAQWRAVLEVATGESLRNRLMLALAYDAALRAEHVCWGPMISIRRIGRSGSGRRRRRRAAGVSCPTRRSLVGCWPRLSAHRRRITGERGALFVSESPRNRAAAISPWTWSKVVRSIAVRAGCRRSAPTRCGTCA